MGKIAISFTLMVFYLTSHSQELKSYSDEELTKFANIVLWAEGQKNEMTTQYNIWIKEMIGVPRFLKLKEAVGDSLSLVEIKASEEELFLFDQIILRYDSMTSQFKGVYEQKIRTEVGVDLYNSLNQDAKTNGMVKARYEKLLGELSSIKEE